MIKWIRTSRFSIKNSLSAGEEMSADSDEEEAPSKGGKGSGGGKKKGYKSLDKTEEFYAGLS